MVYNFVFYPKKSIHQIIAASTELSAATEIVYKIEDEWRKRLWTLFISISVFVLFLVSLAGGISYYVINKQQDQQDVSLEASVKAISKLATVQHQYTDVFEWKDSKDLYLFELKKSIHATGTATVLAGIDLENANIKVEKKEGHVQVVFPHAKIISVDSNLHFTGEEDVMFQRISIEDRNRLLLKAKDGFHQTALDAGILQQAEEKASSQIQAFLATLGYQSAITFQ